MRAYRSKALLGALLTTLAGAAVTGCAVVDQYSGRALGYNVEAEQASQHAILLNIVRASQHRAMQFTGVSTITGTASSSGTLGLSVPLGAGGAQYKVGSIGGSVSGGPSFTVPVLDTQEFYYGLMGPIPGVIFDLYIQAGYPRDLLFNLFIDKIVVHNDACNETLHNADCEFTFVNHAFSPLALDLFQGLTGYLIKLGFTTQRIGEPASTTSAKASDTASSSTKDKTADAPPPTPSYGFCFATSDPKSENDLVPPESRCESPASLYAPHSVEKAKQATAKIRADLKNVTKQLAEKSEDTASDNKQKPSRDTLQNQKRTLENKLVDTQTQEKMEIKSNQAAAATRQAKKIGGQSVQKVILSRDIIHYLTKIAAAADPGKPCIMDLRAYIKTQGYNVCGSLERFILDGKGHEKDKVKVTISVYTRSTENLMYYLGESVRYERQNGTIVKFRRQDIYTEFNSRICDEQVEEHPPECVNVFVLDSGPAPTGNSLISVAYEQTYYSIPADRAGYSTQVLEIVKQLLAMSSSAKSLPQTNVISVLNSQ